MIKHGIAGAALILGLAVAGAPVASAKGVDIRGTATCSPGVKAKFKAGPRDVARIKSNVQIDDTANGIVWVVKVVDGAQTKSARRTTVAPSGSINVDFFTADDAGADVVTFSARRLDGTATCSGTVTVP